MFPILFKLGPLSLHTYGLMVALGFIAGYTFLIKEFGRTGFPPAYLDKMMTLLLISSLIGARIFYFATEKFEPLRSDPLAFFRIWEGGLVFYGGFLGAGLAIFYFTRVRKIPFFKLADALVGPLLLGQAIGRLGCFAAGCCFGKPTLAFYGVTFHNEGSLAPLGIPLYPTQLLESAGNFLLFLGVFFMRRRHPRDGFKVSYYLIGYGLLRFFVEFLRGDFRGPVYLNLYPSQWISLIMIVVGTNLLLTNTYGKNKNHNN